VRIRIRPKEFTQAFVKTADGIKRYIVMDNGDTWTLGKCLGENRTLRVSVSPCEKSESEVAK